MSIVIVLSFFNQLFTLLFSQIMKRLLPLCLLFAAAFIVSCKSTGVVADSQSHGVDASGNVWMNPPPAGQGIQIAILPFTVPDSAEVQGDFYLNIPSDVPFNVGRIEVAMNDGTHHMNLYKSNKVWPPDSGKPRAVAFSHDNGSIDTMNVRYQDEFNATIVRGDSGEMMVEAQVPYLNWEFPTLKEGPNAGHQTCVHFEANQKIVIENHYVNIPNLTGGGSQTTPNGKGKIIVNLWKSTEAQPAIAAMMFARKPNLVVETGDHTYSKDCKWGGAQGPYADTTLYILGMTGHFHSRGKSFWVEKRQSYNDIHGNPTDSLVANIYQSITWNEPPFDVYPTPVKVNLGKGEFLRYYSEYVNTTANPIPFGAHVATQEHMNLFVWFTPGLFNAATCYDDAP